MKKLKSLLALILVLAALASLTSCYFISGQTMRKLKGTYKLTTYTYTPTHERKEGVTPTTFDYVNDEKYKYEDYLIITGTGNGYYVHKDASGEAYIKEVTLRYEYGEDNKEVEYVIFNDSITAGTDEGGVSRLGVSKKTLNYSKSGFDYTQVITKKPMRAESMSYRWEKVDKATDLSYVNSQISDLRYYKYHAFAARGIYELNTYVEIETLEHLTPYQYYFISIDTADGATTADIYFAPTDTATGEKLTVSFSANDDYTVLTIDGKEWNRNGQFGDGYYNFTDGTYDIQIRRVTHDTSDSVLEDLISSKAPIQPE